MISIVVVLVLVLSVALNMFMFMRSRGKSGGSAYSSTILDKIEDLNELTTAKQTFQSVLVLTDATEILGVSVPGTSKTIVALYSGEIICACDLSLMSVSDIFDVNKVKVTLPHSRVTKCSADLETLKPVYESSGIFTSLKINDFMPSVKKNMAEMRAKAEPALMKQADKNAAEAIAKLFSVAGVEAEILFDDSTAPAVDDSFVTSVKPVANDAFLPRMISAAFMPWTMLESHAEH